MFFNRFNILDFFSIFFVYDYNYVRQITLIANSGSEFTCGVGPYGSFYQYDASVELA